MSTLSQVSFLKSNVYFEVSTGLLFRSVVKQAGVAAVGIGGWPSAAVCHPQAKAFA
ncbi:MAG: hypothetical protein VYB38_13770 [Bacteroidota bacterium]|nr:hypothetical protein [Bacteroidota bacterium]MEC8883541.1 hypothetical protein [Bacteroidota bacterium]MEE3244068.1 hypothetical protein [Bacteroidota bacterium]